MSVAKSFFDITAGRSHGVIPTSDAVRIIIDSGATVLLDRIPNDMDLPWIRARAARPVETEKSKGGMRPTFETSIVVTENRVDKALSSLVKRMVLGEDGVEVTEWSYDRAVGADKTISFGRYGELPMFDIASAQKDGESHDDTIARLLLDVIETGRRHCGQTCGRMNAVVVRLGCRGDMVGLGCSPEKPEPPVGATLTARRWVAAKAEKPVSESRCGQLGQ